MWWCAKHKRRIKEIEAENSRLRILISQAAKDHPPEVWMSQEALEQAVGVYRHRIRLLTEQVEMLRKPPPDPRAEARMLRSVIVQLEEMVRTRENA